MIFYDGPENDYGIYSRIQTLIKRQSIVKAGTGKKHIDFLKDDDSNFINRKISSRKHNTRKYNSKQSNINKGLTMDDINELEEELDIDESNEKNGKRLFIKKINCSDFINDKKEKINKNDIDSDSGLDHLNLGDYKNYDKKLSSNLYISLSRKISSVKRTLTKKKKKTIKDNNEEYIEQLHQIIKTQKKRIKELEKDENYDLISFRKKLVNKIQFLSDKYVNLETVINDILN
jgi:hypothetical protein